RPDPAVRGHDAGAGAAGAAAALQEAPGVVPELPAGPGPAGVALVRAGPRRAAVAVAAARPPHEVSAAADARRERVPVRLRRAVAVARLQGSPLRLPLRRHGADRPLRRRRV